MRLSNRMLNTPAFWNADAASLWPTLLSPVAALYALGNRLNRAMTKPQMTGLPVISVGNLVAGGAGKTPTALALVSHLTKLGHHPHIVSRGYGGRLAGPARVDLRRHTAADVGDEPLLLAQAAPTWIGRDRPAAARAAMVAGASCVIADDAHQTYSLGRTLSLLVVDAAYGFGNRRLLPAGPLREPISEGLARSDAVILIGSGNTALPDLGALPLFHAELVPNAEDAARLRGERVLAFAGIARPDKFFASLQQVGAEIVSRVSFADHAHYDADTIMRLVEDAHRQNATPVTTAKDLARFPSEAKAMVETLRVALRFADPAAFETFLRTRLHV
ncbi:tetraacyldisaccharide 4'-kinase [uncultured Ferrovibrio sp.]|jgi:tetraacyldisaccharide 4'-kinase|uniref:tetraacyldisaccharide 4'-kinase n=1 Tax=uncultured Ferrovibrio sp. TaxID=1576913 RepID=UPI00261CAD27|nr:tetraacyldisaccharide 4'-kinase [uncultured Ferrovibrio sp.]